jgi:hypothetical protein
MLLVALSAAPALGVISTSINPANAPNGTHFAGKTSASCSLTGSSQPFGVSCTSYQLAGVGNTAGTVDLTATYTATVVCINNGNNESDGQHQGSFPVSNGPTKVFPDKNGRLSVPVRSVSPPSRQDFVNQQSCPNPNWTPTVPGGISLQSFTYTFTFDGFSGAYITITGP